jgi:hypothetical protein
MPDSDAESNAPPSDAPVDPTVASGLAADTAASFPASKAASSIQRPVDPIMGRYIETAKGSNVWNALVGGKPNPTWTGLCHSPAGKSKGSAYCYRSMNPTHDLKGHVQRCKGL